MIDLASARFWVRIELAVAAQRLADLLLGSRSW